MQNHRPARRPRIVLLHASAGSSRQWRPLAAQWAPRADVHAIDLLGHGTNPPWRGPRPMTLADDVALVAPLLAGGAHLVGHSYGGAVALAAARAHPGSVRSLAVYEPVAFPLLFADADSADEAAAIRTLGVDVIRHVRAGAAHAAAQRFIDFWAAGPAWAALPGPARDTIAERMAGVARQFGALAADHPFAAPFDALHHLPVLVLTGARTVSPMRRLAVLLRQRLPHAAHETLPGMGHMGPITHAEAVNRLLDAFLAEVADRPDRLPHDLATA